MDILRFTFVRNTEGWNLNSQPYSLIIDEKDKVFYGDKPLVRTGNSLACLAQGQNFLLLKPPSSGARPTSTWTILRDIDYGGAERSLEVKSRAGLVRFET